MIKFKGCPKCQGDLYLASDIYGRYFNCLQCGFTKDLPAAQPAPAKAAEQDWSELFQVERKAA